MRISAVYEDNQKILACWEDAQYSYNLFRAAYGNAFGLVAFSKRLDIVARDSSRESDRLDKLEAPARELAQQVKQEEDKRGSAGESQTRQQTQVSSVG